MDKKDDKKNNKNSNSNSNNQQQQQPKKEGPAQGPASTVEDNNQMSKDVSTDKSKADLKELKSENKSNENKKPTDPKIYSSKSSNSNDDQQSPSLKTTSNSSNGAVQSLEEAIVGFDKEILSINNSILFLQLRIGSLNMRKESDIKLKFELDGKITALKTRIAELEAKKEINADALAQAKQDELNKNNNLKLSTPKIKF